VLATCASAGVLLVGCGHSGGSGSTSAPSSSAGAAAVTAGATSPTPSASELVRMWKLVDDADSATAAAESDAADDK
jgi:hypothetical protein